jgi:molecular chaperone GrpE
MNPSDISNPGQPKDSGDSPDPLFPSLDAGEQAGGADPDQTAALIDQLQAELAHVRQERDIAQAAYKQSLADFANYQRRSLVSEQQAREQAIRRVLESVIPVVDHFEMALSQNPETATAQSVIEGVSMIRDELVRALSSQGVGVIKPAPGETFDATRHKAILQQVVDGAEAGTIVSTVRIGFVLDNRVVRPAEVIVAS